MIQSTASYPTTEILQALTDQGGTKAVHDAWCEGGWIHKPTGSEQCAYCVAERQLSRQRSAIEHSGIGARYLDTEWAGLELPDPLPELKAASERITDIITAGHSAILAGPPGSGKTQAATLLLKAAILAGHTARLENIGRAAMDIRAGYDNPEAGRPESLVVNELSGVDLLILDDIGAGEAGDGKIEQRILYFVTEARQNARRATILTTNLTAPEVKRVLGDRIVNRLMPLRVFAFNHGRNFRKPTGTNAWDAA